MGWGIHLVFTRSFFHLFFFKTEKKLVSGLVVGKMGRPEGGEMRQVCKNGIFFFAMHGLSLCECIHIEKRPRDRFYV